MCLETLLWLLNRCCCTWMLDPPQKDEDRVREQESPLTSDNRSSRLPRPCTSRESVLIAACKDWKQAQPRDFLSNTDYPLSFLSRWLSLTTTKLQDHPICFSYWGL